jgi:DNA-binding transcriptional MerR regulator
MENVERKGTIGMVNGGKTYYSISEVCGQMGVEPHVLRYWESEFPLLRPKKNRAGNRAYRDKDIDVVKRIRRLLYEEGFTIPGAKKKLAELRAAGQQTVAPGMPVIRDVRKELEGILQLLTG